MKADHNNASQSRSKLELSFGGARRG